MHDRYVRAVRDECGRPLCLERPQTPWRGSSHVVHIRIPLVRYGRITGMMAAAGIRGTYTCNRSAHRKVSAQGSDVRGALLNDGRRRTSFCLNRKKKSGVQSRNALRNFQLSISIIEVARIPVARGHRRFPHPANAFPSSAPRSSAPGTRRSSGSGRTESVDPAESVQSFSSPHILPAPSRTPELPGERDRIQCTS